MNINDIFTLRTVRKKILLVSKLAGMILLLSYVIFTKLQTESDITFAIWFSFVILLVLTVDLLMGHFISKPISKLNQTGRKMAKLDFSCPCIVASNDEFGELSANLNVMAERLQEALAKLESANIQLEKEVEKERRLLEERRELADSLSHEMKTPLGVIRAFAEGLQEETDEEERQRYYKIIISETERMSGLITTLLDLSSLETGASALNCERLDFVELVEIVAGRLLSDIPDTDFEILYELPDQKEFVYVDKRRMEQVLDNLIMNARKNVSPEGLLKLSLTKEEGKLHFSVYNDCLPIPEESLQKIWTKFYRDGNTKYSGSGLGLTIVAQILDMHGIPYGVKNLTDGVQFYFSIPTAP